jgi:acyl carrier protein
MREEELQSLILRVLAEAQTLSGREWTDLGPDSKPIGDLDGFDSLSAVETTIAIEQWLECKFEVESVFVSGDGKRALTIKQICAGLTEQVTKRKAE